MSWIPEDGRLRRRLPRPETLLLLISLVWTVGAKTAVVCQQQSDALLADVVVAVLPDLVFFSALAGLLALVLLIRWSGLAARAALLVAAVVLAWSILNAAWLLATSGQLHPGILGVLGQDPSEFWPIVRAHLAARLVYAIPILLTLAAAGAWLLWRLVAPVKLLAPPGRIVRRAVAAAAVCAASAGGSWLAHRGGTVAYSGEVLGYSSHWRALAQAIGEVTRAADVSGPARVLPRAGQRAILMPGPGPAPRPNVVVIFLESVSYPATSLGDEATATTPFLRRLASEGVEFADTRVPVAQTSKAFWTALTGSRPEIHPDYAESVLVDRPYESLASVLGGAGYRTGFFQMARGSFECAPGLFRNLDFDWAWFRENLEDESANLGYMSGDDRRMIEPIFDWVDGGEGPFLLGMITSVSHDPYELPADWPEAPEKDRYQRYLQTVRFNDAFIERICGELERRGMLGNTLLCILGDHGEGFRPESKRGRWVPFEEVIRVPWVIRWPGHLEAGTRIEWPCSQLDVTPTILAALGARIDRAGFEGVNALERTDPNRRLFFSTWFRDSPAGFVEGDRKLVYRPYLGSLLAYDLARDPGERAPRRVEGAEKKDAVEAIRRWQADSRLAISARRFREATLYGHWRTFSSGRSGWAYYVSGE